MESVFSRYRNLIILVGVLFLQVLGLAVQVKRSGDGEGTRLIRIWAVSAVTPLEKGLVALQNGSGNIWHNYIYLRGVRAENRDLKAQLEHLRLEQVRLSEDATQARRLQNLLAFKEQYISKTVAAQVIGSSGSDLSRAIYIDKGSDDGVQPDLAVITAGGIVGKVLRVYPSTALVLLINDQSSGVGAVLEKSRLQGVLRGTPNGEVILERVMSDEQVSPGETVLTSGGDQVFPKGLPVGTIAKVGAAKDLFLNITIRPSADLDKLEEVLVVLEKQEKQAVAVEEPHARAADILAQRLPSVPDPPPAKANANTAASGIEVPAPGGVSKPADGNAQNPARAGSNSDTGSKPPGAGSSAEPKKSAAAPGKPATTPKTTQAPSSPQLNSPAIAPPAPDQDTPH